MPVHSPDRPSRARRPRGIGFYLIALIVLAVVPLGAIAGVLVARQANLQREAFDRSLLHTALALSVAVDRQLETYRVMLETLGEADTLRTGDFAKFHALAARVAATHSALFVSLFDGTGTQIFNTLRPFGEPLPTPFADPRVRGDDPGRPPVGDALSLKQVLETGRPVISDLFFGLVAGRLVFTVNIPVVRAGRVAYVLNAAFTPDVMTGVLEENRRFRGVPAVVFDRRGFIVARWEHPERYVGQRVRSYARHAGGRPDSFVGTGETLDGMKIFYSYARSETTGWGVNVGVERTAMERALYRSWLIGGLLAVGGLGAGVVLALGLASRLRQSIVGLAESGRRDGALQRRGLRTREVAMLERMLAEAAAAREAEGRERESRLVAEARKAEAEDANRMKDRFIAVMSHELRNPLAPIRTGIHLLQTMRARGDPAATNDVVDMLARQSDQLVRLVDDLLDVSRIGSGTIALHREPVDLGAVARHAIETAQPGLEARRHRFVADLPAAPLVVDGDFVRLSQVVSNLLDNAAKYTPDGGLIRLALTRDANAARLRVEDNGRGIDPAFLPEIFTPFRQAGGGAPHRGQGGLGLGLSLAKTLVELHGGVLEAESAGEGRGSAFTLRLPLAARPAAAEAAAAPAARAAAETSVGRRVLVVDDNADAATSLGRLVASLGHQTRVVLDGTAALRAATEFRPEIVLLDVGMPGLDGFEVARRLRALEAGRSVLLVAVTGWGQDVDRAGAAAAGFDVHLVKPVSPEALAGTLARTPGPPPRA